MEPPLSADPEKISLQPQILYSAPRSVGEFSLNDEREMILGRANARYACDKFWSTNRSERWPIGTMNLDANREGFVNHKTNEYLTKILQWLQLMGGPTNAMLKKVAHEADFVTWRGVLTRIAVSPYDKGGRSVGLKVACCRFKNVRGASQPDVSGTLALYIPLQVIFIAEYETEAKVHSEATMDEFGKKASFWGYSFEHLITSSAPDSRPDASKRVSASEEFVAMLKTCIGPANDQLRLLFGAEIDCIDSRGEYMEIKTQFKEIGIGRYFEHKAVKWWMQSFLAGVKTLIVGLRNNDGLVNRIEPLSVDRLPKICSSWNYAYCLTFLYTFLTKIREMVNRYPEGTVVVAERSPHGYEFNFTIVEAEDETNPFQLLTDQFKSHFH